MVFSVNPSCIDLGLRAAAFVLRGAEVGQSPLALRDLAAAEVERVRTRFADASAIRAAPEIAALHAVFRRIGVSPRRNQPASQRLAQMALSRGVIPEINNLVDAYNVASVRSLCCLGAHDLTRLTPPVTLRLLTGKESFVPLGASEAEPVQAGEFGYVDADNHVLCRLDVMQADQSKISEASSEILVIVEGTSDHLAVLDAALQEAVELTTRFCGGRAEIVWGAR